jgi:leucine-rich repeat protein SHOC2
LRLDGNRLTSLPAEIGQLTALEELHLNGNLLTTVSAAIGQLRADNCSVYMDGGVTIDE